MADESGIDTPLSFNQAAAHELPADDSKEEDDNISMKFAPWLRVSPCREVVATHSVAGCLPCRPDGTKTSLLLRVHS